MGARLVTVREYAERFGISEDTVRRWARKGIGPRPIKIGPRAVRYRETDINAYLEERVPA